jgi:hypothetical protein
MMGSLLLQSSWKDRKLRNHQAKVEKDKIQAEQQWVEKEQKDKQDEKEKNKRDEEEKDRKAKEREKKIQAEQQQAAEEEKEQQRIKMQEQEEKERILVDRTAALYTEHLRRQAMVQEAAIIRMPFGIPKEG